VEWIFFYFGLVSEKKTQDSVQNEFSSVRFLKKAVLFGYYSYLLLM